ncbi:MAG: hypothetical protein JO225_04045 [Candidatus Eremiobacteraeota bacterium]|nr:hypothetical protein [Candidatus Eremiobacteraeota bacterium]
MKRFGVALGAAGAVLAVGLLAAWPKYVDRAVAAPPAPPPAALPTAAPVAADYALRDRRIAFWERAAAQHRRGDMLSPSVLSEEYLQRYRERGDVGDALRALGAAQASLRVQPRGNLSAETALGSALLTLHRFRDALAVTHDMERVAPGDPALRVREASLDLELGDYGAAKRIVDRFAHGADDGSALDVQTLLTRWDELTGHLDRARRRFARTTTYADAAYAAPAQERAWFWFRSAELAFEAGDTDAALGDARIALARFPNYGEANRVLARVDCALHRWRDCLAAARASARVTPYPEVLGYEVDALRALGERAEAAQTDDLIAAVGRLGDAQHVTDRLLAVYDAEHGVRPAEAYRLARGELAARDDVFTEDTLAWSAAADGRWDEARTRARRAVRLGTENALLDYHAGVIALHAGDRDEARRRLRRALARNARFHPWYADDARRRLAQL